MQGGCFTNNYLVVAYLAEENDVVLKVYDKTSFALLYTTPSLSIGHANTLTYYNGYIYIAKAFEDNVQESNVLYRIAESNLLNSTVTIESITLDFTFNGFGYANEQFVFYGVGRDFSFLRITDTTFTFVKDVRLPIQYDSIVSIDYYDGFYVITRRCFDDTSDIYLVDSIEIYDSDFNLKNVFVISKDLPDAIEFASVRRDDGLVILGFLGRSSYHFIETDILSIDRVYANQAKSQTIVNENILINSDFTNPFNSLGFSSMIRDQNGWTVDKWHGYVSSSNDSNAIISLETDGLRLKSSSTGVGIIQTIPDVLITPGKPYTLSIEAELLNDSGSCVILWGNSRWNTDHNVGTVTNGRTVVRFDFYQTSDYKVRTIKLAASNGCEVKIKRIKLEKGRASTLEDDLFSSRVRDSAILSAKYVDYRHAFSNYAILGTGWIESGNIIITPKFDGRQAMSLEGYKIGSGNIRVALLNGTFIYNGPLTAASSPVGNVGSNQSIFKLVPSNGTDLSSNNGSPIVLTSSNNVNAEIVIAFDEYSG